MPAWVITALWGALHSLLGKLLGEKFLALAFIISARATSKMTKTTWDDEMTEALATAWEVPKENL